MKENSIILLKWKAMFFIGFGLIITLQSCATSLNIENFAHYSECTESSPEAMLKAGEIDGVILREQYGFTSLIEEEL